MQPYVILCHARTGSNYLVAALAQHPEIMAHNELFHERSIYYGDREAEGAGAIAERDKDPIGFLKSVLAASSKPVSGFKHLLFYHQEIIDYVLKSSFKILILERENILAHYSSFQIAHQTGQWTVHQGEKPLEAQKLAWNEADFEAYRHDYIKAYAEIYEQAKNYQTAYLKLEYKDLFLPETMPEVFSFLGVEADFAINSDLIHKQNSSHIAQRFEQAEAVEAYLQKIGHPEWAEELF